jgi:peptidyl-prolyl cis-trans isomerase C
LTHAAGHERDAEMIRWSKRACALGFSVALLSPQPSAAGDPQAGEAERRAQVVLQYAGGQIRVGELEDAIQARNPFMQERYRSDSAVQAVLERELRFRLLAAEAEQRGYGERPQVRLAVKQNSVQALIQHDFDDKFNVDAVPAAEVAKYYKEHLSEFVRGEGRRVSWLLAADEAAAKALLPEAKAADMRAFRDLVRNKSVDATSKQRGGDLHYFDASGRSLDAEERAIDPAIVQASFALHHVGDTSEVVHAAEGFGVLRLSGIRAPQDQTLADAEERVRARLWREQRQAAIDATLEELKKQLKVAVHPELIAAVNVEQGPALPPAAGLPRGFPHTRPGLPLDTSKPLDQPH